MFPFYNKHVNVTLTAYKLLMTLHLLWTADYENFPRHALTPERFVCLDCVVIFIQDLIFYLRLAFDHTFGRMLVMLLSYRCGR